MHSSHSYTTKNSSEDNQTAYTINPEDIEFIYRADAEDIREILLDNPSLNAEKIFKLDKDKNANKPFVIVLGEGTFSKVRLAKVKFGPNYIYCAARKIKSTESLMTVGPDGLPRSPLTRPKVVQMTKSELEILKLITEILHDDPIIRDRIVFPYTYFEKMNSSGEPQIYQILPLADIGNGNDYCLKLSASDYLFKDALRNDYINIYAYMVESLIETMVKLNTNQIFINDIKPDNILFFSDGKVCFADFGSASIRYTNNDKEIMLQASELSDIQFKHPKNRLYKAFCKSHNIDNVTNTTLTNNDPWALGLTLLQLFHPKLHLLAIELSNKAYLDLFRFIPNESDDTSNLANQDKEFQLNAFHTIYQRISQEYQGLIQKSLTTGIASQLPESLKLILKELLNPDGCNYEAILTQLPQLHEHVKANVNESDLTRFRKSLIKKADPNTSVSCYTIFNNAALSNNPSAKGDDQTQTSNASQNKKPGPVGTYL